MRWRLSTSAASWLVAGVVVMLLGILARRADVTVLGVPLLVGGALSWTRRSAGSAAVALVAADQSANQGRLVAEVEITATEAGPPLAQFLVGAPGHRTVECVVVARPRSIDVQMSSVRTGRRTPFWLDHRFANEDLLLRTEPVSAPPLEMTILPGTRRLPDVPLPFRLQGLTGPHGSRRAGDGGELYDVAPFRPGDRLRRIDWRVTARLNSGPATTQLFVRRTFATADATVMLVVDSRDDVGPRVVTWGDATALREDESTSLDLARFAAASVARFSLEAGDRVGLEDLGRLARPFPPAGGRQQLHRLVQRLAAATPVGEPTVRRRVPRLPSGALIVVFSTFLDDGAAHLAESWRHSGHRVVAVDILPSLNFEDLTTRLTAAYRIVAMERVDRIEGLGRSGVEVIAWQSLVPDHDPGVELGVLARQRERR